MSDNQIEATSVTVEEKINRMSEIRKTFEDPEKEITIDEADALLDESARLYQEINESLSGTLLKVDEVRKMLDGSPEGN